MRAVTEVNTVQAPKMLMQELTRHNNEESRRGWGKRARHAPDHPAGVVVTARTEENLCATRDVCAGCGSGGELRRQRPAREGWGRPGQIADGLVLPSKPGNAGGGKEP